MWLALAWENSTILPSDCCDTFRQWMEQKLGCNSSSGAHSICSKRLVFQENTPITNFDCTTDWGAPLLKILQLYNSKLLVRFWDKYQKQKLPALRLKYHFKQYTFCILWIKAEEKNPFHAKDYKMKKIYCVIWHCYECERIKQRAMSETMQVCSAQVKVANCKALHQLL